MKTLIIVLIVSLITLTGCASSDMASKSNMPAGIAVYVSITKNGDAFSYPGGKTRVIRSKVNDDISLRSLNDIIQHQVEKSKGDRDRYNTGFGGFETCLRERLYVLYMSRGDDGTIMREWYETLDTCN